MAAIVGTWFIANAAHAQVLYSTSFEAPIFANGDLTGQDGWLSTDNPSTPGRAVVQSDFANTGMRSARFDAAVAFSSAWYYQIVNFTPDLQTTPIVQISWMMYLSDDASPNSFFWGVDIYDDTPLFSRRISAAGVNDQNEVVVWNGTNLVPTGHIVTRNAWHQFVLNLNFASGRRDAMVIVDDVAVAIQMPITSQASLTVHDVNLFHIDGGGEDAAYYDDFTIAAYPDADGDGVPDVDDDCPATAPGDPVDFEGCSTIDEDGDGVGRDRDLCPGTPPCATSVDENGCPDLDDDGDGAPDGCDNCPGLFNPDQTDTDGDGIGDACDDCPDLAFGDLNGDHLINGGDIQRFTELLLGDAPTPAELCAGDFNDDGDINFDDLDLFIQLMLQ